MIYDFTAGLEALLSIRVSYSEMSPVMIHPPMNYVCLHTYVYTCIYTFGADIYLIIRSQLFLY